MTNNLSSHTNQPVYWATRMDRVFYTCFGMMALLMALILPADAAPNLIPRWRWSNPLPHGANVFDMAYGLGLTVQVAERGQIYSSEDLIFWQPLDSTTTNTLLAVTFFGGRIIAAGESGTVVYADSLADFHKVDLGTSDWLLGAAASANFAVLVGDNAAIYSSADGAVWVRQAPPSNFTQWLRSVTYGKNLFVAVGENGAILTSPTGNNWKKETSGITAHLNRVAYVNDQFMALGDGGIVLTSANGSSWTPLSGLGATNALFAAAGGTNDLLVAGSGELRLRSGTNAWSNELLAAKRRPAPAWTYYSAVKEGDLFFVAGRSGMMAEGVCTNAAADWILRYDSIRNWLWDVARIADFYVAVGDRATILTSVDGLTWTPEAVPDSATNTVFLGVGASSNRLVAVGNKGAILTSQAVLTNVVLTNVIGGVTNLATNSVSSLGVLWQEPAARMTTNDLQAVAQAAGRWVVAGGNGTVLLSQDATNWTVQTTPTNLFLSGAAAFAGGFVVVGDQGVILTSPDGQSWTRQASGTTNWLFRVRCLDGRLFALGQNGTLLSSSDGTTWTACVTGTARWLNDIAKVGETFYAVGNQGTVLASSNAVQWIPIGTITQKSLFAAAATERQLLLVGIEGAILRSQIIPDPTPVALTLAVTPPTNALVKKLFLIKGRPDQVLTLDNCGNFTNWFTGPLLELLDPSGTLLYLEESQPYEREFFRGRQRP